MPFISGDSRANEQINLAVMHTIWMREHNRIASDLRKLNPSWDDEKLYQEARRINVAQYQHIVYKEWLPLVLGHDFMDKFGEPKMCALMGRSRFYLNAETVTMYFSISITLNSCVTSSSLTRI